MIEADQTIAEADADTTEADPIATESDRVKPWTVKGIAPEDRNAAIAAAKRNNMQIGEWLARAIRAQVQADHQASRAPVPVDPAAGQSDLGDIERLVVMVGQIAAATGEPPPKAVSRAAYRVVRDRLAGSLPSR